MSFNAEVLGSRTLGKESRKETSWAKTSIIVYNPNLIVKFLLVKVVHLGRRYIHFDHRTGD